jgi:hypothetical protein
LGCDTRGQATDMHLSFLTISPILRGVLASFAVVFVWPRVGYSQAATTFRHSDVVRCVDKQTNSSILDRSSSGYASLPAQGCAMYLRIASKGRGHTLLMRRFTVNAEIHGDFKWNEPGGGNNSCSYRAHTAPASINIYVLPRVATSIDTSAFRLTGVTQRWNLVTATFEPIGDKVGDFEAACSASDRFSVSAGSSGSGCTMEFAQKRLPFGWTNNDWHLS